MTLKWASTALGVTLTTIGMGWFMFNHFAQAEETAVLAQNNAAVVDELQKIRRKESSAAEAKRELLVTLCLSGRLKDRDDCASVGVRVD